MLKLLHKIQPGTAIACSGGIDSMVVLDYMSNGGRKPTVIHMNHGTEHGIRACEWIKDYCSDVGLPVIVGTISEPKDKKDSWEEYWRKERYKLFSSIKCDIVTAHHLEDAVETWMFGCIHGVPKIMPYRNGNVIRPFLPTDKKSITDWAINHNVPWIDDPSNNSDEYMRNVIRNNMMPIVRTVNPGINKVIKKKILERGINT